MAPEEAFFFVLVAFSELLCFVILGMSLRPRYVEIVAAVRTSACRPYGGKTRTAVKSNWLNRPSPYQKIGLPVQ